MLAKPYFTVAICTYNRAKIIERAIKSVVNQTLSPDWYEILVVDNNSTDNTCEIINNLRNTITGLRLVSESQQGFPFARNRAIAEARGEVIVYLDDDAEMCPDYLMTLKSLLEEEKNVGAVGGPVEVGWLCMVPDWYEPLLDFAFNYLYIASYRLDIRYPRILYGTNMAFPKSILLQLGGFRTDLCKHLKFVVAGDDNEMMLRITHIAKLRIIYEPALRVRHFILPSRLSPEYLLEKAEWTGRAQYYVERLYPGTGGPLNPLFGIIESSARRFSGRSRGKLYEKLVLAHALGYLSEWWKNLFRPSQTHKKSE